MNQHEFEIAISCLNDDIYKIERNFNGLFNHDNICIHIVHQINIDKSYSEIIQSLSKIQNVRYSLIESKGLPYSRNYALESTDTIYLIPTDADVVIKELNLDFLKKEFKRGMSGSADYLSCQSFYDSEFSYPRKKFRTKAFKHNRRSLLSVSSIELILKVSSFKNKGVRWDKDFGLGSKFPGGLETVMLQDAYKAGLIGYYIPIPLCSHEEISSGNGLSPERIYIKSAVLERIFGKKIGLFLSVVYITKNIRGLKKTDLFKTLKAAIKEKNIT